MSARKFSKPVIWRAYLYYVCVASARHWREICSARKHKAEEVETRI